MTVVIEVAVPAAQVINANHRGHWSSTARKTAYLRMVAHALWVKAGRPRMPEASCVCHVRYPARRARDVHNLYPTAKALIDGIVNGPRGRHPGSGLLPDDSDRHLTGPDMRASAQTSGTPGVYLFQLTFTERSSST